MLIKRSDLLKYLRIVASIIVALVIISFTSNMLVHLCVLIIITGISVIESKFNMSHPYFWFSAFFFLYNCAYMIILVIAPNDSVAKGYNSFTSILILVALATVLLVNNPHIKRYDYSKLTNPQFYNIDIQLLNCLLTIFVIIQLICTLVLHRSGVTSKSEQWMVHNMFWIIATYCSRFNTYILAVLVFMGDNLKKRWRIVLLSIFLTLYFSLLTGERDAILRIVIILLLSLAMIGKIHFKQLIVLTPICVTGMIALNYFKYYLSTGNMNRGAFALSNTLYEFLYSDFVDCGSNLQVVVNADLAGTQGIGGIFKDIISAVLPSSAMNTIFGGVTGWNVSEWYNDYFYRGSIWNRAFTLVGEGYVMASLAGVILLFVIIGLIIRLLYKNSDHSPYYAAIYIYTAVAIISAFRGDASTIFSYLIRVPILITIFLWILKNILYTKEVSNDSEYVWKK